MKASSVTAHRRCFLISGTGQALTAYSQAVLGLLTAINSKLILVRARSAIIQGVRIMSRKNQSRHIQMESRTRRGNIMKKLLFSLLIVLSLFMYACSAASTGTPISSTDNELPFATQLAVGTLKLEDGGQDVTPAQAEELVVYWQVYKELGQSETAAQAEIDGVVAQIQETMTDPQLQAITDMALTQQDVLTAMQGITVVSSNSSDSTVSLPSGGNMPAGGPPSDGGGAPPDGGMAIDGSGVAPAVDQVQSSQFGTGLAGTAGAPSTLIDAVIESLQQRITA
jgi:hypothetical protein